MYTPKTSLSKTNLILDLITQRQKVLGTNIANMDTPNYIRKDLDFKQYLANTNNPLETQLSSQMGASGVIKTEGGKVDVINELTEMQKSSLLYTVATRRMSSIITEMKTALNVGK